MQFSLFVGIVQGHRNAGGAGIAVIVHDRMRPIARQPKAVHRLPDAVDIDLGDEEMGYLLGQDGQPAAKIECHTGPDIGVEFFGELADELQLVLVPLQHTCVDRLMGAARIDSHPLVVLPFGNQFGGQHAAVFCCGLQDDRSGAVGKQGHGFFVLWIQVLAHRIGADDQYVAVLLIGAQVLRTDVESGHEAGTGRIDVESAGVLCCQPILQHGGGRRRDELGSIGSDDDQIQSVCR